MTAKRKKYSNNRHPAPLPANYLAKKGGKWHYFALRDVVTMMYCLQAAVEDDNIGFEDANNTHEYIMRRFNRNYLMNPVIIESALWACSMLHEKKKFKDIFGRSFDQFIKSVTKGRGYHYPTSQINWQDPIVKAEDLIVGDEETEKEEDIENDRSI